MKFILLSILLLSSIKASNLHEEKDYDLVKTE